MKSLMAAVVLATLTFANQAGATVINFDSFADSTILAVGSFDAIGVRFNQKLAVDNGGSGTLPQSAPNAAINTDAFGGDITGFFLGPVTAVDFISVYAGDSGGDSDTVTLFGYDALNNLVDSDTFTGLSAQTLSISGAGITRFEIIQSGLIGIDDFTFNATSVPEPGTLALLGMGLAGVAFSKRRFKA